MNIDSSSPSILVRLMHSVPHINVTLNRVNNTFDPKSVIYKEVSIKTAWILSIMSLDTCEYFLIHSKLNQKLNRDTLCK